MAKKFKVGQKGVYPAHGVVEVQGIEEKEISGSKSSFYILKVVESDVTLMVPTANAKTVGLRSVVAKKEVPKILDILSKKNKNNNDKVDSQSWNKRYREYADKLKSGDIYEIAHVLKDIYHLRKEKDLSFGEKRIMESALSLLVKELSVATKRKEEQVSVEIKDLLT
ncbi:MAG: CarD family transcriptional regulator [Candidatus Dadabacteria bacterium]|nr:CarD family transcriptional regulator [Candidatus Dadabacteria bacterium]NIQ14144.1 CarD family transcriptional regulator [Candidatus Dadabacteria bacterium]